jgi:TolB protein
MTGPHDPLRRGLADLADQIGPVDLYAGSLRRSRRIGRRRVAVTSAATVLLVAMGGAVLTRIHTPRQDNSQRYAAPVVEAPQSVPGLPGTLFYVTPNGDTLVRIAVDGKRPVMASGFEDWRGDVTPDGKRIAYVADDATVRVIEAGTRRSLAVSGGEDPTSLPSWSPDGTRLLLDRKDFGGSQARPGVFDVESGTFTPLAVTGHHLRWSGDGRSIVYATDDCRLMVAASDGTNPRQVPVLGDGDRAVNPSGSYACIPVGASADASRVAVTLHSGDASQGSGTDDGPADSVIETATGQAVPLPVEGLVNAALFRPDGTLLIRSDDDGDTTLTLLSAADTIIARVIEPATLRDYTLVAYTH